MKNKGIIAIAALLTINIANAQSNYCDSKSFGSINYNLCNFGQVGNGSRGTTGTESIPNAQNTQSVPLAGQQSSQGVGQVSNAVVFGSAQPLEATKLAQDKLIAQIKAASVTSGTVKNSSLPTDQTVIEWLKAHPSASDYEIAQAMQASGTTVEQLARVTGLSTAEVQRRVDAAYLIPTGMGGQMVDSRKPTTGTPGGGMGGYSYFDQIQTKTSSQSDQIKAVTGTPTDQAVRDWLKAHPDASDYEIAKAMFTSGTTVEQMARVTGLSTAEVQRRVDAAYLIPTGMGGQMVDSRKPTTGTPGGGMN